MTIACIMNAVPAKICHIFSAESQKGVNAIETCSIENQKGAIANKHCTIIVPFWLSSLNNINTFLALN